MRCRHELSTWRNVDGRHFVCFARFEYGCAIVFNNLLELRFAVKACDGNLGLFTSVLDDDAFQHQSDAVEVVTETRILENMDFYPERIRIHRL